jgi:hypothetical protein
MIGIEEANDIYLEVLLEPYNVAFCTVENLGIGWGGVNDSLKIREVISPSRHPDQ